MPTVMLNICNCGSSGSTLLARLLDRHPDIACGDEMFLFASPLLYDDYALFRRWSPLLRWTGVSSRPYRENRSLLRRGPAYGLGRGTLWRWAATSGSFTELVGRVRGHVLRRTGKRVWAEKTPRNIRLVRRYLETFPDARVIHIVRDPRDVVASLAGRGKSPSLAADAWLSAVACIQPLRNHPNVLELHYEALCTAQSEVLARVCEFAGVDFDERHFASNEHASRGLRRFGGHASWTSSPDEGLGTGAIGRHREVDLPWDAVARVRLTTRYRELVGCPPMTLAEAARSYGYDVDGPPTGAAREVYRPFTDEWRLDPLRRWIDRRLGVPDYVPATEHVAGSFDRSG